MKLLKQKKLYIIIFIGLISLLFVSPSMAKEDNAFFQDVRLGKYGLVPDDCADSLLDCRGKNENQNYVENVCSTCGFEDFIILGINVANIILGLSGSIALFFFVYGGLLWIISSGSSAMVEKGRKALVSAIIGLAIIFGSWMIINFTIAVLSSDNPWQDMQDEVKVLKGTEYERTWWNPLEFD